ncbi:MAG: hypothetical protein LBS37_03490, partial [Treponema sp.]|nr:hypothetical protein [Treponema sp.]
MPAKSGQARKGCVPETEVLGKLSLVILLIFCKNYSMAFTRNMLNRKSSKPLYAQLKSIIKEKIENGEW